MNTIKFDNIEELDLPKNIKLSLEDQYELANIHFENENLYIILNYPEENHRLKSLCVSIIEDAITLYIPNDQHFEIDTEENFPRLILSILNTYENLIRNIREKINDYETIIEKMINKDFLIELYIIRKKLKQYEVALHGIQDIHEYIMEERPAVLFDDESLYDYAGIKVELQQLMKNIEISEYLIIGMIQVSESTFSHQLNQTIKLLTSVTLIFSIPLFFTGLYGMNVTLPFASHPNAFAIVSLMGMGITLLTIYYFYKKKWF